MNIFLIPKIITNKLNGLLKSFWWGSTDEHSKIQWIDWGKMGLSKELGGLSFRDVGSFNLAMLAK